ncbi:MAG: hypothetical protein ACRDJW_00625 [Thermomicrobiales bacterium]
MLQSRSKPSWIVRRAAPLALLTILVGTIAWQASPLGFAAQDDQTTELQGDFTVGLNEDDVPRDLAFGPTVIGQWRVSFNADGSYEMERLDIGPVVSGSFTVDGRVVTITDESGLMSCSNPVASRADLGDVSTGSYEFTLSGENLSLAPLEDNCATRRLILSTREMIGFVQCLIAPVSVVQAATPAASPAAEPVASPEAEPIASPEATPGGLAGALPPLPPPGEGDESADQQASPAATGVEAEIDALLDQMTACWATGEPAQFLPLVTDEYQEFLAGQYPSEEEFLEGLGIAMGSPITFSRSGDLEIVSETEVEAIVNSKTGPEDSFVRFSFVLVDGSWKWNGPA